MRSRWGSLHWAAICLVAFLAVSLFFFQRRVPVPLQQLQECYSAQRPFALRIRGARHSPIQSERGFSVSHMDRPHLLLEVEAELSGQMPKKKDDAEWLHARGLVELLEGNYEAAIDALKAAQGLSSDQNVTADLAAAYFERGETRNRPIDRTTALDILSSAIARDPSPSLLYFNRALMEENLFLYHEAVADWETYLSMDSNSDWRDEARERLDSLQGKLHRHSQLVSRQVEPAEALLALSPGSAEYATFSKAAGNYLGTALDSWLPLAFAEDKKEDKKEEQQRKSALKALHVLAVDLREHHHDLWLSDLLAGLESTSSTALGSLVEAVQANTQGNHGSALHLSNLAADGFGRERNDAGKLRAKFEAIYAEHLSANGYECYRQAQALLPMARARHYAWLEIQTLLESAVCAAENSKFDDAVKFAQRARDLADSDDYGALGLRATVFVAGAAKDSEESLFHLLRGLDAYWNGNYDSTRGYSLYALMDTTAEGLGLWHFDKVVIQEALGFVDHDADLPMRAMERYRFGRAQLMTGETTAARESFDVAQKFLKEGPPTELTTEISIELADTYASRRNYEEALLLLAWVKPHLPSISHDMLVGEFYSIQAEALLASGRNEEAQRDLMHAITIADRGLASIADERARFKWIQSFGPAYHSLARLQLKNSAGSSFLSWEEFKGASVVNRIGFHPGLQTVRSQTVHGEELPSVFSEETGKAVTISYAVFPDGIVLWVANGKQVHSEWLAIPEEKLESLVRQFSADCANPNSNIDGLQREAQDLYLFLIQPARQWLKPESKLIVETDGILEQLPFEVLANQDGELLSDAHQIAYSPGLLYLAATHRGRPVNRGSRALIVGNPLAQIASRLVSLPDAAGEAEDIAGLFPGSISLMQEQASLSAVVGDLPRAEVVHFASHAIANAGISGIVLAGFTGQGGDGLFTAAECDRKALANTQLVVLSACSTVRGPSASLSDRDSLPRTLLGAGVPQVLASRWPVDSAVTRQWMKVFYGSLLTTHDAAEAARKAEQAIRSQTRWRHPFYWAAFSVFGE